MDLKSYIQAERGNGVKLAATLGIPLSYLSQMAGAGRAITAERAVAIERATGGIVGRRDLRPDDWADVWPELAAAAPEPSEAKAA